MPNHQIVYKDPNSLKPRVRNPRTHSARQLKQLVKSIKSFGFTNPVLIDKTGGIIAGHGRVAAAKLMGMSEVPTMCVGDDWTPAQIRAYVIADNKIAENAGWDPALLAIEVKELSLVFDFDLTLTGFETTEIDILIGEQTRADVADDIAEIDRTTGPISRLGDRWLLGNHVLVCGNSLNAEIFATLLGGRKAQMVFVDPPYNLAISGHVSGLGKAKHREFESASGEMNSVQFTHFLTKMCMRLSEYSSDVSIHFICMDWRHLRELLEAAQFASFTLKNICVWAKTNGGMGSFYRSQHEMILVFKNGIAPHINNIELGRFGRNRTNVWTYAGANTFSSTREDDLAMHPTVKPLALVTDAIMDCSHRGGIILDSFAGTATTLLAAEKIGRKGFGIEIDPHYVDAAITRFNSLYNIKAIHSETGLTFDATKKQRSTEMLDG